MAKAVAPKVNTKPSRTLSRTVKIPIIIDNGHNDGRQSRRVIAYRKHPSKWTTLDLLAVIRLMAKTAATVRRVKIADERCYVTAASRDGGTELSVNHTAGAWAKVKGADLPRVPAAALAGLAAIAETLYDTTFALPAIVRVDRDALRRKNNRFLRMLEIVRANILASTGGVR